VEAIIGYDFKNKHLLEEAFTHNTYGAENDLSYERLEYVGDVVLNKVTIFFSISKFETGYFDSITIQECGL
jgi:dsRNA-specific ribonuclease